MTVCLVVFTNFRRTKSVSKYMYPLYHQFGIGSLAEQTSFGKIVKMVALKSSSVIIDNKCNFCPKVFCCSECRDNHEDNKHIDKNSSKPKCVLCYKLDLRFDPQRYSTKGNFDDSQFICHVVFNHLPLRCKICGDKFNSNQDFQNAKPCKGPINKPRAPVLPALTTTPQLLNNNQSELFVTPSEEKLPLTPQYHIEASKSSKSSASDSASLIKQPDNFDSPPELARHTSTPMHLSVVSLQKNLAHPPNLPNFDLKTPTWQRTFDNTTASSHCNSAASAVGGESRYYTADVDGRILQSSLEASNDSASTCDNQHTPIWISPVYPTLKSKTGKASPLHDSSNNATSFRAERSILKSVLLSRIDDSRRDSIEKRVRFSDQFATPQAPIMADTSVCDNDEFFEARESLDDEVGKQKDEIKVNSPIVKKKVENLVENCNDKDNTSSTSTSSSRVVMMLLVEKTDNSKGFSSLDLAPLIDSGLKKLEESASSIDNSKSDNVNDNRNTGTIAKATSQVTSYTREIDGSLTETSKGCRRRASIKDTVVTRTDRIECITPPNCRRTHHDSTIDEQKREFANKNDSLVAATPQKNDSLFSAVARVWRNAMKKLPASVTARNLSREPLPAPSNSPIVVAEAHAIATSSLIRRSSIKRPRERIDSHDEVTTLNESPGSTSSSASIESNGKIATARNTSSNNHNNNYSSSVSSNELVVTSPAAKRHRGWYRIRAREPIARMRERQVVTASPRGASRETQRFQQGTLSIGDTFITLPSRAHQSTQTED